MSLPVPPKPVKRKRTATSGVENVEDSRHVIVPAPTKRKRTAVEIDQQQQQQQQQPLRTKPRNTAEDQVESPTPGGGSTTGVISKQLLNEITYGTTRKQRHWVVETMMRALKSLDSSLTDEELMVYFGRVEQRLYNGIFGKTMNACYNMYRARIYRKMAFEIIYALRANGVNLMRKYEPELLAALPPSYLSEGTVAGEQYRQWKTHRDNQKAYEEELRQEKRETKGQGWLQCPRCGGRFVISELQMRGADEPATIFRTCQNCGLIKRNG
jgi:hypothetical protein